jgi:arylsulfatase A-like enzyme
VLQWNSALGAGVLAACAAVALLAYLLLTTALRALTARAAFSWLVAPWGTPLLLSGVFAFSAFASSARSEPNTADHGLARQLPIQAPDTAGDILFIVVDTLRADHLPCYGYARGRTPELDRFARDAVRFESAYANASWTRPSFASLLTGRYAASHRTMSKNDALPEALVTLPEALRASGYRTFGVVTNYNIAPFYNFDQGFDAYTYLEPDFVLGASETSAKLLLVQTARNVVEKLRERRGVVTPGSAYRDAQTVNSSFIQLLDQASQPQPQPTPRRAPFFGFVAYMDPHDPYYTHPYDGTGYSRAAHLRPEPREAEHLIQLYDGEITYWDEHFGALIRHLRERGLYDDMTIVVTSDHGEEFADHGGFWHGTTLYDEVLHVPLLIKLPQNRGHGRVQKPWVQSIDLMPSLLGWAGLQVRSEERRVGKECRRLCRSRWSPYH